MTDERKAAAKILAAWVEWSGENKVVPAADRKIDLFLADLSEALSNAELIEDGGPSSQGRALLDELLVADRSAT